MEYELKVQGLVETVSFRKSGSSLELHHAVAKGQLEDVRFLVEKSAATQCSKIRMALLPYMWQQLMEMCRCSGTLSLSVTATQHVLAHLA